MEEEFACAICLDVADEAVETSCCHHIFCNKCLQRLLGKECPQCRHQFNILVSHVARRIIGNLPTTCPHEKCGKAFTRSNLKDHVRTCEHRIYDCPSPTCAFKGGQNEYLGHLYKEHRQEIVENAHLCLNRTQTSVNPQNEDRIGIKKNTHGREARIGETGKYYCEGELGDLECDCCDGNCGPGNGCNCQPCMKLDIASRDLPKDHFVNREGAICRQSNGSGLFYCGRKVMSLQRMTDGFCGPNNGPHCSACEIMQYQYNTRYLGIW